MPKKKRWYVPNKKPFKNLFKKKKWRKVGRILGYICLALLFITAITFAWFSKDLPTAGKIKNREVEQSTKILDRDGKLLYKVHGEKNRTIIDFEEIPDDIKYATIAVEDHNFYKHMGVDITGVIRAAWVNMVKGGIYQGGSTLTQQLVKNALLSPKRTYTRKVKELILSIEMEILYSKDEVLGMYLNEIPYGSNAYGIESASQTFFNKHAKDLNLNQAATLAALPRAPTYYSPYGSNTDELKNRRNLVLNKMAEFGYISQEKADQAKKKKMAFSPKRESIKAPHFVMYVKQLVANEYGERMVEEGGLTITTTLNQDLQKIAEEAVSQGAARNTAAYNGRNAALVSIDPKTGGILAMVGSRDFFDIENDGNVNVAVRERQPGSSFKPIVYATLFKDQWSPGHTLFDLRTTFGNDYEPQNYSRTTRGPVSIRTALAGSLNIPAVKALSLAGLNNSISTASDMGITTLTEPQRYGLSLVLGGGEVKLLELAQAYSVFANQGVRADSSPILKIEDSEGKVLKDNSQPNKDRVLKQEIAYEVSDILSDTNARQSVFGFSPHMSLPDREVAVKTGTTNDFKDAWTMGYTPNIVAGVWAGNNDNSPMAGEAPGSVVAAPIWHDFMNQATRKYKVKNFQRPETISDIYLAVLSNKKATNDSWKANGDIAAPWQVPDEYDDTFQKIKVDKKNGLRATDSCPASFVEEKTFGVVHSAQPDNPNWENPVQAWARQNKIGTWPPEKVSPRCKESNQPTAQITNPSDKDEVSGVITISTSIDAPLGVNEVAIYLDGNILTSLSGNSYSYDIDTSDWEVGDHNIKVIVTDNQGLTGEDEITVTKTGEVEGEEIPEDDEGDTEEEPI